jgi:mannosyltransferase OCH1-like enzyme
MIPKRIYQTWKTKDLPRGVSIAVKQMMTLNPQYTHYLYNDREMDEFMRDNYSGRIYNAFCQLAIGAARADLWRYCILYKYGGVYLDIDAGINKSLDDGLIRPDDDAIITREQVEGLFNQWIMIFSKGHPLLKAVIDECLDNIEARSSNNILHLTGSTVFTQVINHRLKHNQLKYIDSQGYGGDIWHSLDNKLEVLFNDKNRKYRARFYGIDMNEYASYHNSAYDELYTETPQWETEQKIKSIFIDDGNNSSDSDNSNLGYGNKIDKIFI